MKKYLLLFVALCCVGGLYGQKTLTLEESKQLALENNCAIKNSVLEVKAARQTRKAAFTKYFPSISASGFMVQAQEGLFQITNQGGNLPVYDGNPIHLLTPTQFAYFPSTTMSMLEKITVGMATAVQPVFAGGRIVNANKLASLGVKAGEWKGTLSKNQVLLKTEEQYWLVVSLHEKLKTVQQYEELLTSLQQQVADAYKSGLVMKNDLLKVELKRSEVQLNKSKLQNGIKLATMAFCQHIGMDYDSTLVLRDALTIDGAPQALYVDHQEALRRRTEYNLLQASVRAEELQSRMKLGEYLPQAGVGLSGLYMKMDEADSRTIGMVFGTVTVPISGWWEAAHTLSERKAKVEIAKNNMKDHSELLLLQMQKAWQDLSDAWQQVQLSEQAKAQAEENLKVNEDSYKNGLITVADWLEAQAMRQQMNDQLTDAKAGYRQKQMAYLQATGR